MCLMFSFSWAVTAGSGTCYSRGHLLVLQCPGGPSRTLHVSRRELFSLCARVWSTGWQGGSTLQEQWGQGGDCCSVPCSSSCTPGAGLNSLGPAVSHRAGMERQTPALASGFQSVVPLLAAWEPVQIKAPSLSAGLWHEFPIGSHSFNP